MGQWYEQPEDTQELKLFEAPKRKRVWLFWAVMGAIWAALVLVAVLASGCAGAPKGAWRASLEIRYANGQRITAAHAGSADSGAHESDSPVEGKAARGNGAGAPDVERPGRTGR